MPYAVFHCAAGSAGGVAKNFATLVEVLGEFGEVRKPQQEQEAAPVSKQSLTVLLSIKISLGAVVIYTICHCVQDAPPELAPQQAPPRVLGVLDEGFVRLFEPVAAMILRTGTQQGMTWDLLFISKCQSMTQIIFHATLLCGRHLCRGCCTGGQPYIDSYCSCGALVDPSVPAGDCAHGAGLLQNKSRCLCCPPIAAFPKRQGLHPHREW